MLNNVLIFLDTNSRKLNLELISNKIANILIIKSKVMIGEEIFNFAKELWPINRSLTGGLGIHWRKLKNMSLI